MVRLVNQIISTVPNQRRKALKILGPLLDARRKQTDKSSGEREKPVSVLLLTSEILGSDAMLRKDDMITWLMEIAKGEETTNEALTDRLLAINFGAIHTTSVVSPLSIFPRRPNSFS